MFHHDLVLYFYVFEIYCPQLTSLKMLLVQSAASRVSVSNNDSEYEIDNIIDMSCISVSQSSKNVAYRVNF